MPLSSTIVGGKTTVIHATADARWLMAYAAGLRDFNPRYLDTAASTVIAHPVFAVCLEWPANLGVGQIDGFKTITQAEAARGVHASHDLHVLRPIKAGDRLTTQGTYIDVRAIRPGASSTLRLDTIDTTTGELVARTYQSGIHRGVQVTDGDRQDDEVPALPPLGSLDGARRSRIEVPEGAAHVYTECARIFNPIHTDRAVALAAGLPDIILHGTATLALAVSRIVNDYADGDPTRVTRLGGRFAAMVLMPSTLELATSIADNVVTFEVLNGSGETAIRNGFVVLS